MVHVSELKNGADGGMLTKIDDELNVGDVLQVKVSGVTTKGDIYLTQRDDTDMNSIIDPKDVQEQQDNDEKEEEEVSIESDAVPHNAVCNMSVTFLCSDFFFLPFKHKPQISVY
jgi:predicted RNA-binding protein with RPS1 domain